MLGRAEAQLFEFMLIAEVMKESEKPLRALEPAHPGQRSYMAACVALGPRGMLYSGNQELRDQGSALWSQIKNLPLEQALERCTDTPIGNMIYQLFPHWDYARRIRRQLVMQLRGLAK